MFKRCFQIGRLSSDCGLEVTYFTTVTLPATIRGQLLLSKYERVLFMGSFLSKPETLNIDETTHLNEERRRI